MNSYNTLRDVASRFIISDFPVTNSKKNTIPPSLYVKDKTSILALMMSQHKLDILNIIDTHLPRNSTEFVTLHYTKMLVSRTRVYQSINSSSWKLSNPGGITIVVAPHLSTIPITSDEDPSRLGIHMYINLKMLQGKVVNITIFRPFSITKTE